MIERREQRFLYFTVGFRAGGVNENVQSAEDIRDKMSQPLDISFLVRSVGHGSMRDVVLNLCVRASSLLASRPTKHTLAPSAASETAIAPPMPPLAPVTSAIWLTKTVVDNGDVSAEVGVGMLSGSPLRFFQFQR